MTTNGLSAELAEIYRSYGKFVRTIGREIETIDAFEWDADLSFRVIADSFAVARELLPEAQLESFGPRPAD